MPECNNKTHRLIAYLNWYYLPCFGVILLIRLMSEAENKRIDYYTRDPAITTNESFGLGMISQLDCIGWAVAAAICLLVASVLKRSDHDNVDAPRWRFLRDFGLFTAWLGLDDLFLFHDRLFREYVAWGEGEYERFDEVYTYPILVVVCIMLLIRHRKVIATTAWGILVAALTLFTIALTVDQLWPLIIPMRFIEDCATFLGIATWLAYFVHVARQWLAAPVHAGGLSKV